mmetsp:Transcript_7404/g.19762  ORF Transcript_7404/g.19762 Transcript_7404/m.19762 type:complete len:213 (-) Transcript_7404:177-815(-)
MPFSLVVLATAFVCTSFTCWQNFIVESVSSKSTALGDMAAIITVLEFPHKDSLRTWVSFESRKGGLPLFLPLLASSEMTLAKVERALLIAAPSFRRSPSALVRLTRSEPAKSTKCVCDIFVVPSGSTKLVLKVKIQWLLLLDTFIAVALVIRASFPMLTSCMTLSQLSTGLSFRPGIVNPSVGCKRTSSFWHALDVPRPPPLSQSRSWISSL